MVVTDLTAGELKALKEVESYFASVQVVEPAQEMERKSMDQR